ncbi:unnamed protein product [Cunninghamella blakesleeana]
MTSLSLRLSLRYHSKDTHLAFKLAIFNMITQYTCFKNLIMDIIYNELLQENDYFELQQQYPARISSNSTLNKYNNTFFQRHSYLNHSTSLPIGRVPYNAVFILYYFYLCNGDSAILSNYIEMLSIDSGNDTITEINDGDEFDEFDNSNNNHYNVMHLKHAFQFLKEKMELQQLYHHYEKQLTINSSAVNNNKRSRIMYYKLKKIEMKRCNVHFKVSGWNGFFKSGPHLKEITLLDINLAKYKLPNEFIKLSILEATFDLSHLSLDLLKIKNFNYQPVALEGYKRHFVKELMIKVSSTKSPYYVGFESKYKNSTFSYINSTTLNNICEYIDDTVFHYYL